jgi:hypothetical protein
MDNITMPITVNIVSEEKEESGLNEDLKLDPCRPSNALSYPLENQEQYKAKINFTVLQVISPVSIGNEGGEYVKQANQAFSSAKEANRSSREAKNASRTLLNASKNPSNLSTQSAQRIQSKQLASESEKLSKQSVQHAKDGSKHVQDAFAAFFKSSKFSDRSVERRPDVPSIQLYLPVAFQQNDSFSIPGTELGLLGAGALAGMNSGSSLLKSTMDQFSQGLGSVFDMAKGNLNASQAAVVTARLANKVAPSEIASAFSLAAGVTVNPNVRSIFKGVNLREYSFQFKFLPKSRKEAEVVEEIIDTFRKYSYPEVIDMGPVSAGYKYPDMFGISVYVEHTEEVLKKGDIGDIAESGETTETVTRRKRVGNRMKNCYLRAVSTNYNASSMAFHPDGRPVEIDLSLNFVEEETISRRDVEEGY